MRDMIDASGRAPYPHRPTRRDFLKGSAAALVVAAIDPSSSAASPLDAAVPPRGIHPYPNKVAWGDGLETISRGAALALGPDCDDALIEMMKDTWRRFTSGAVELTATRDPALRAGEFTLGGGRVPKREAGSSYALSVAEDGIAASAADPSSLRHAWFTLLQLLDADDAADGGLVFTLPRVEVQDWPAMAFRGLHVCIFPESQPHMIERAVRLAAFFKFTHVVLEFWGMLKLDALKELSWPRAWSKAEAGRLVAIARGMGLEVVPMFNSWGHAAGSRIRHGRHVVLDQNPRLASMFEPDGWTWCLTNPRSLDLLRRVHDELIEFAGPGRYCHIGCDEAYSHATCDRCRQTDRVKLFADHVNNLAEHLEKRGRRTLMWGDALLERAKFPGGFAANGTPALPTHLALDRISRKIVINDWHYDVKGEIPTLSHFKRHGFETIACPWNSTANIRALTRAALANGSAGLLMTTWHHLSQSIPTLHYTAACMWSKDQAALGLRQADGPLALAATAAVLRKLAPAGGQFERAGWSPFEAPFEVD